MLTGFIEYFKTTKPTLTVVSNNNAVSTVKERHWPKKYAEGLIASWKKLGYVEGAEVHLRTDTTHKLRVVGYADVPETGYKFWSYPPPIIHCVNKYGTTMSYRLEEIMLIDKTTGEITC